MGPVTAAKKTATGQAERRALLGSPSLPSGVAPVNDLLDALACAWTGARFLRGEATVLGTELLAGRVSRIVV